METETTNFRIDGEDRNKDYSLRRALPSDKKVIRRLVRRARINPLNLHWSRFTVAVDRRNIVIGSGQIKRHNDGSLELASLVVRESWRGRGVARTIIEHLIDSTEENLFLACLSVLAPLYEQFGFERVSGPRIRSRYFRRMDRFVTVIHGWFKGARYPVFMYRRKR